MALEMSFKKGMDVNQIKEVCDTNSSQLWAVIQYLNQSGKEAMNTYNAISFHATFSENIDDLAKALREEVEGTSTCSQVRPSETAVIKNIKHFIKNYLD